MSKKKQVVPAPIEISEKEKREVLKIRMIQGESFDPDTYEYDDSFKPGNVSDFRSVHTMVELAACVENQKDVEVEGIVLEANKYGTYRYKRLKNKKEFLEAWKSNANRKNLREAKFREDSFATDTVSSSAGSNAGLVGDDFVPLLGGPFNKQPYLYDYLRAHAYCFHEYHHHPFARAIVHTTRDFVLGGGYRVDSEDEKALALWHAFEQANDLEHLIEDIVKEGSTYGENMIWWLPNSETTFAYNVRPGQEPEQGLIPRIRLIDPSTCWEIVTMPEDQKRVLFYWIVYPTQYQIKTGQLGGQPVPTSKFIVQQLPASDVMHFKYNCMSNEKRGRSDLFPILGYLKWTRDYANYKLISAKKQAAWTEDIVVEGSQADVDGLAQSLQALGEFENAGSRFIHTDKIKREYLENKAGSQAVDGGMMVGVDMIAAGSQIPVTYFGLSHSGGQTRASALVGTEPVAKKFERRQREVGRIIKALWKKFQEEFGIAGSECEVTFPEIITQDRSAKLKDLKLMEDCGYIARSTAAPIAAKEIDLENYDYDQEKLKIEAEDPAPIMPSIISPLTAPPAAPKPGSSGGLGLGVADKKPSTSSSAVTSDERKQIKDENT